MHLILRPHALSSEVGLVPVAAGQTLLQMLQAAAGTPDIVPVEVAVNGYPVPAEYLGRLRPKEGAVIHVTPQVLHGGSTRQILGAIAMIVVSIYAPGWGNALASKVGLMSAAAWSATITIAANLAISALVAPPAATQAGASGTDGAWNALTGSQNNANPWGPIPLVIGEARFFPPHAALPYSRSAGNDSFHHYLFDLGYGELDVSDIRIGDTPIGDYEDVQWEVATTPTLYRDDINELAVGVTMEETDSATRTTSPGVEEISLDLLFASGVFAIGDNGKFLQANVFFNIEYRLVGAGAWTQLTYRPGSPNQSHTAILHISPTTWDTLPTFRAYPYFCRRDDRKPFTASLSWTVPAGQYEVRVTRAFSEWPGGVQDGSKAGLSNVWTVLRSIRHTNPSTTGTNKLAVRIRASDQLNGVLQTLSCLVKQKIPVYDRDTDTWSVPVASTNPAWVAWWLMTACPALARHAPVSRMSLDGFADYAEFCTTHALQARLVQDNSTTARQLINKVLAGSLANLGNRDGRYAPVFDHGETLPSRMFTPDETSGMRVSRAFTVLPHALRVQFVNTDAGWQDDEVIVLADGYSYRGVDARGAASALPPATTIETLRLEQAMDAYQAWRLARFHLAQADFRPNVYTWASDIAGMGVVRGDVVDVSHYVPEWGAGYGRVRATAAGGIGGAAVTVELDRPVETDGATPYGMQFRHADGTSSVANLVASGGMTTVFALETWPPALAAGDMAVIGERGVETAKLLITEVRHQDEFVHQFSAVEYDPRVAPYWADPPESIISEVSGRDFGVPPPPSIDVVTSDDLADDRDDAGISTPVVSIIGREPREGYIRMALQ